MVAFTRVTTCVSLLQEERASSYEMKRRPGSFCGAAQTDTITKKSRSSMRCCRVKSSYQPLLYTILEENEELMHCEEGDSSSAYNFYIEINLFRSLCPVSRSKQSLQSGLSALAVAPYTGDSNENESYEDSSLSWGFRIDEDE